MGGLLSQLGSRSAIGHVRSAGLRRHRHRHRQWRHEHGQQMPANEQADDDANDQRPLARLSAAIRRWAGALCSGIGGFGRPRLIGCCTAATTESSSKIDVPAIGQNAHDGIRPGAPLGAEMLAISAAPAQSKTAAVVAGKTKNPRTGSHRCEGIEQYQLGALLLAIPTTSARLHRAEVDRQLLGRTTGQRDLLVLAQGLAVTHELDVNRVVVPSLAGGQLARGKLADFASLLGGNASQR